MSTKSNVLNIYKKMLIFGKSLPEEKRAETLANIRQQFRANVAETDPAVISELVKKANSSLGYLKMVTPRVKTGQTGVTKIVLGERGPTRKAVSNWTGNNLDPDSVKRHQHTLKRAGFRDNAHAKGIF